MQLEFNKVLKVFIKSLTKLGFIKKTYTVTYQGPGVSVNDYYSSKHWHVRSKIKEKYKDIFLSLFYPVFGKDKIKTYCIVVFFNNGYDVDNVVGIEKIFVDTLRYYGTTENDTKTYFKSLIIAADKTLPKNTFQFLVCKFE